MAFTLSGWLAASALTIIAFLAGVTMSSETNSTEPAAPLEHRVFQLQQLEADRDGRSWHEFLRTPAMYSGLYVLPAGGRDGQQPHDHDEVYYVLKGAGEIALGPEQAIQKVSGGSVIFVKAHVEHRFVNIEQDLHLLVFFSTAPSDNEEKADNG